MSIGQGQVSVTPMSLAVMMMTVANGGTRYTPHVLKADRRGQGLEAGAGAAAAVDVSPMKTSTVEALHDGLWMVVNAAGTGGRARISKDNVAARPARRRSSR